MDRFGFIHEKLDIKILILFTLKLLPEQVSFEQLSELVMMVDDGFDYFEYSQCLAELVSTGHIRQEGNFYAITEKGAEHGIAVESSIPYSVRKKTEKAARPFIEKMQRNALIGASHKVLDNGGCMVRLTLSDGVGDILGLSILTSDEEQAKTMENYFRGDAERLYHEFIRLLTPKEE